MASESLGSGDRLAQLCLAARLSLLQARVGSAPQIQQELMMLIKGIDGLGREFPESKVATEQATRSILIDAIEVSAAIGLRVELCELSSAWWSRECDSERTVPLVVESFIVDVCRVLVAWNCLAAERFLLPQPCVGVAETPGQSWLEAEERILQELVWQTLESNELLVACCEDPNLDHAELALDQVTLDRCDAVLQECMSLCVRLSPERSRHNCLSKIGELRSRLAGLR